MEKNINDSLNDLTRSLFDIVSPRTCPFCGVRISKRIMCEECEKTLPRCEEIRESEAYRRCTAPVYLEEKTEKAINNYIYKGEVENLDCFGAMMAECAQKKYEGQFDIISYVPCNKKERRKTHEASRFLCASLCVDWHVMPVETLVKEKEEYIAVHQKEWTGKRILMISALLDDETAKKCTDILTKNGASDIMWQIFALKQ